MRATEFAEVSELTSALKKQLDALIVASRVAHATRNERAIREGRAAAQIGLARLDALRARLADSADWNVRRFGEELADVLGSALRALDEELATLERMNEQARAGFSS